MNNKGKEIIVIGTIDNEHKQIVLSKEHSFSNIYNITIDKTYHGQVLKTLNDWRIFPHEESWLKGEICDIILQAVFNVENPNS